MESDALKVRLKRWLDVPALSNEDEARRANLLKMILVTTVVSLCLVFVGSLLGGKTAPSVNALNVAAIAVCLILHYWLRRGRATWVSF